MKKKTWIILAVVLGIMIVNVLLTNLSNDDEFNDDEMTPINSNISTH
ncbi:hypothetical protein [Halalkalibacter wakoensis]|nr:hypothetical protein [Halalkalibacter wakoensis]